MKQLIGILACDLRLQRHCRRVLRGYRVVWPGRTRSFYLAAMMLLGSTLGVARAAVHNPDLPSVHIDPSITKPVPPNLQFATPGWYDTHRSISSAANRRAVRQALGWHHIAGATGLCQSGYWQPQQLLLHPVTSASGQQPIHITSSGPTSLLNDGRTVLRQNVVALQEGRMASGDKAILYRNKDTGKLQKIEIFGHARYQDQGRLLLGQHAVLDLVKNKMTMDQALYHMRSVAPDGSVRDSWGTASQMQRLAHGVLILHNANYTTCAPGHTVWRVHAHWLRIDKHQGRGVAHNAWVAVRHLPVFYSPYFNFPVDNRRKSGFLWPTISYIWSKHHGTAFTVPYYWNVAPNQDVLFTPQFMTHRGVQFNQLWRYLSLDQHHSGQLYVSLLPHDTQFAKDKAAWIKAGGQPPSNSQYSALQHMSDFRSYINYQDQGSWGRARRWHSQLQVQHVSDPYFFQDFSVGSASVTNAAGTTNQLFNQAEVSYSGNAWQAAIQGQGYQTLHPLYQNPVDDQYWRLPEIDLHSFLPRRWGHLDISTSTQFVNFITPYSELTTNPPAQALAVVGQRLHNRPGVLLPLQGRGWSLTPQYWQDSLATSYNSSLSAYPSGAVAGQSHMVARSIPMLGLDAKAYLEGSLKWSQHPWLQTLEPELLYLYVPYRNQDKIPSFDTERQSFSYARLFALNQFTGFDRLQNANQLSMGLTTRTVDGNDGHTLLSVGSGMIWYFADRKVTLAANETLSPEQTLSYSPWVSNLIFNPNNYLSLQGDTTWNMHDHAMDNADASATLNLNAHSHLSGGYTYTKLGASVYSKDAAGGLHAHIIDLHQAYVGANTALGQHVQALGYINYNFAQRYPITSFVGLQYASCCWAMRVLVSRDFTQFNVDHQPQLQTRGYLQFELSGLGSVGNRKPTSLLSNLPGYVDRFDQGHAG